MITVHLQGLKGVKEQEGTYQSGLATAVSISNSQRSVIRSASW